VLDAERFAGERVHDCAVAGAVIREHALDRDAIAAKERDRSAQKAGGARPLLVVEHLDVSKPRRVVDGDVNELPADPAHLRAPALESLMAFATTSLQGRSDEQRSWELQLDA
jgi:hypothetical protein